MAADRTRAGVALVITLALTGAVSVALMGTSSAHRAGARHNWNAHLLSPAKEDLVTKKGVQRRIERALDRRLPSPTSPSPVETVTDDPREPGPTTSTEPSPSPEPSTDPNDDDNLGGVIFGWSDGGDIDDNVWEGVGYAALGLLGALVTALAYMHSFLPSVSASAEYLEAQDEVAEMKEQQEALRLARKQYTEGNGEGVSNERLLEMNRLYDDLKEEIDARRGVMRQERRQAFRTGFLMHLVIGSGFAVLFATNPLQGLLIGFGWTTVADRMGLKRTTDERLEKKDKKIEEVETVAAAAIASANQRAEARLKLLEQANAMLAARVAPTGGGDSGTTG